MTDHLLPASTPWRLAAAYVFGVLLARLVGLVAPFSIGPLAVTLSAIAFPVAFWTGSKLAMRPQTPELDRTRFLFGASVGIVGDELVYLATRADGVGYWSTMSLAGSAAIAVLALGVIALTGFFTDDEQPSKPGWWLTATATAAVALSFIGYRASQVYLRSTGVPNEERSLIVAGYEIHHATTGSLLLIAGGLVLASRGLPRRVHRVAVVVLAVGAGFIADEYPYLFYPVMTDELYFELISLVGGAVATVTVMAFFVYNTVISQGWTFTREYERNEHDEHDRHQ